MRVFLRQEFIQNTLQTLTTVTMNYTLQFTNWTPNCTIKPQMFGL